MGGPENLTKADKKTGMWVKEVKERRDIPFGSSEEYWAMNESLTQLIEDKCIKKGAGKAPKM